MERKFKEAFRRFDKAGLEPELSGLRFSIPVLDPQVFIPSKVHWEQSDNADYATIHWTSEGSMVDVGKGCLRDFIKLSGENNDNYVDFAKKWGVLDRYAYIERTYYTDRPPENQYMDIIARWQFYSQKALAILSLCADIMNGKPTQRQDWGMAFHEQVKRISHIRPDLFAWEGQYKIFHDNHSEQMILSSVVTEWLASSHPIPYLQWTEGSTAPELKLSAMPNPEQVAIQDDAILAYEKLFDHPELCDQLRNLGIESPIRRRVFISPRPCPLYTRIGLELAATMTSPNGLFRCEECKKPYEPKYRKARLDRRCICDDPVCKQSNKARIDRESRQRKRK